MQFYKTFQQTRTAAITCLKAACTKKAFKLYHAENNANSAGDCWIANNQMLLAEKVVHLWNMLTKWIT